MVSAYTTPRELVEALQQRGEGARMQLQELLREPVARLMEGVRARFRLGGSGESLARRALQVAETHLRTRPARTFASMTWPAFRAAVVLHVAKVASQPFGRDAAPLAPPGELPPSPVYHSEVFFLPHERVGEHWFGGDWFGGLEAADGSLWVLVADITGHGYYAYLLASTLPGVWQTCWESAPATPGDLLSAMHDLLEDCLPEGVYAECTLVRLGSEGEVVAAPAGGSRLLLRRGRDERPVLLKLRGTWLGLARPSPDDQQTWLLDDGDELLLGTDGLFDQLDESAGADVIALLERAAGPAGLFERVRDLLQQALDRGPQQDDITMLLLRRRCRAAEACADLSSPHEAGDVSM